MACYLCGTMPRLPSVSVGVLIGASYVLLLGCDQGSTTTPKASAGATSGGSTTAGTSGVGGGGGCLGIGCYETSGGVANLGGTTLTAGTAGTGTAGGSGGAGTAGASSGGANGSCAGALFCDDFESYTGTPGAPWTVKKNAQGAVVIDGAQHKSGSKAVKFTTTGADSYQQAFIDLTKPFPVANNAFYGRMMIYTTKAANDGVHWTMIQGEGPATSQGISRADVRYGGQHQQGLMANYDSAGKASDCWQHSQTKMPEGKWACMEWYFEGATNTQKFWLDGKAIDDLTVAGQGQGCVSQGTEGKWLFPSFEHLDLGWESYQTDDAREVWIDDVAIGTTQIGCPK
jgi:hypothetical protein